MTNSSQTWLNSRTAGVLAHVSSLPGEYGIGNIGTAARRFVDLAAAAGFRYWQICPIGPTGFGDSPYQTFSGRAGNPYFIDLGELVEDGLIPEEETAVLRAFPADTVNYGRLYEEFWSVLATAHERFVAEGRERVGDHGPLAEFEEQNRSWLEGFSLFMALKDRFGGAAWTSWPAEFRDWKPGGAEALPDQVRVDAKKYSFYQYLFFSQWERLRRYARERRIGIIGDVPIFVALDSADVWQNRQAFRLDEQGNPTVCAGVPPDYFSAKGQLWGNPLYDWYHLASSGFAWWIDRLRSAFALYEIIRLDHFRGFDTYWEIPAGAPDACGGRWRKGPGLPFFEAVKRALPEAKIIAEDLGYIGPDVVALRRAAGLPGMKILQFAYGHDANNVNLPHFYTPDSIAYTGTHDNITTRGWLESLESPYRELIHDYYQLDDSGSPWPIVRAALATPSRLAVIPLQDLLDLDATATLNRPGTSVGNWQWRATEKQLKGFETTHLARVSRWITLYDRTGEHSLKDYSEPPAQH